MNRKKSTEYVKKRDVDTTPEPQGSLQSRHESPLFVVQKHAARHTHYDSRLEDNGVLKSWAVPKGPSTDHLKKQLAIETEDHPLEYAQFEGTIPPGEYGAGKVIIWDKGTYKNRKPYSLSTALLKGEVVIELHGKKLKGDYALIRTSYLRKKSWLLIKMKDAYDRPGYSITEDQPASIVSGKTIEELDRKDML